MERVENRVIKWVIGTVGVSVALVLGFIRLSARAERKKGGEEGGARRPREDARGADRDGVSRASSSPEIEPAQIKKLIGFTS
mmetsp:Transcript_24571/g.61367  ORF Transcript_24571/g.61367 Transcript_24571/m.61367 type:complete len:82 (+) Transcript_24571:2-247(+)